MTLLRIFKDQDGDVPVAEYREPDAIAAVLSEAGVRFEQWQAQQPLTEDADQNAILAAYAPEIDRLKQGRGLHHRRCDSHALRASPKGPNLRQKFLDEHIHKEDESALFL